MYWYIVCSNDKAGELYNLFNQEFVSYILNDPVNQSKNCSGQLTQAIPTAVMLVSLLHTQFPGSEDEYNRLNTCVSYWALGGSGYETCLGTGQLYSIRGWFKHGLTLLKVSPSGECTNSSVPISTTYINV